MAGYDQPTTAPAQPDPTDFAGVTTPSGQHCRLGPSQSVTIGRDDQFTGPPIHDPRTQEEKNREGWSVAPGESKRV